MIQTSGFIINSTYTYGRTYVRRTYTYVVTSLLSLQYHLYVLLVLHTIQIGSLFSLCN